MFCKCLQIPPTGLTNERWKLKQHPPLMVSSFDHGLTPCKEQVKGQAAEHLELFRVRVGVGNLDTLDVLEILDPRCFSHKLTEQPSLI